MFRFLCFLMSSYSGYLKHDKQLVYQRSILPPLFIFTHIQASTNQWDKQICEWQHRVKIMTIYRPKMLLGKGQEFLNFKLEFD